MSTRTPAATLRRRKVVCQLAWSCQWCVRFYFYLVLPIYFIWPRRTTRPPPASKGSGRSLEENRCKAINSGQATPCFSLLPPLLFLSFLPSEILVLYPFLSNKKVKALHQHETKSGRPARPPTDAPSPPVGWRARPRSGPWHGKEEGQTETHARSTRARARACVRRQNTPGTRARARAIIISQHLVVQPPVARHVAARYPSSPFFVAAHRPARCRRASPSCASAASAGSEGATRRRDAGAGPRE